jgi:hypothetical protein
MLKFWRRKNSMKPIFIAAALFFPLAALGADGGTVILLRGIAKTDAGKILALKDVVIPGTTIKTESKSFVKLLFADKTQMNIGPDTTLKLEQTRAGDPSLVNLVGGQIRAKVTKDLLKGPSGETKDKMIIKTKTAAMGIRGTDFNVSFNPQNNITALITFEGSVTMVRSEPGADPVLALAQTDQVQTVGAGQFSGAQPDMASASIPVKISPAQIESLRANESFQGLGEKGTAANSVASPVPPGVDPRAFSSGAESPKAQASDKSPPPEGFFDAKSGAYAPRAGGFIDLASGRYVPPPPGSSFDPATGVFVPPTAAGAIDPNTGMYVPPKGVELDPVKGFVPEASPRGAPEAKAPPAAALALALNQSANPANAGVTASFNPAFAASAGPPGTFQPPPPPPPPPPGGAALPPPPPGPVSDPTCVTCIQDNIQTTPTITNVRFNNTVTP